MCILFVYFLNSGCIFWWKSERFVAVWWLKSTHNSRSFLSVVTNCVFNQNLLIESNDVQNVFEYFDCIVSLLYQIVVFSLSYFHVFGWVSSVFLSWFVKVAGPNWRMPPQKNQNPKLKESSWLKPQIRWITHETDTQEFDVLTQTKGERDVSAGGRGHTGENNQVQDWQWDTHRWR